MSSVLRPAPQNIVTRRKLINSKNQSVTTCLVMEISYSRNNFEVYNRWTSFKSMISVLVVSSPR